MKIKKLATILFVTLLSFMGVFFGCKPNYNNFSIEINGENTINLSTKEIGDLKTEAYVQINIKNAPNDACRNISTQVSKENIITISKVENNNKDIAVFKIKALENISSYDPSCEVTFKSAEGNKTCRLKVNVIIPVTNITKNEAYSPYVVAGDLDENGQANKYYIDTASLITFSPSNTTQRDIVYSLVDETLKDRYDIVVLENGAISVGKVFDESNVAVPTSIKINAKSKSDETKSFDFDVRVLRAISYDDFEISYRYDTIDAEEQKFSGEDDLIEGADNSTTINTLIKNGISLASNKDSQRNVEFNISMLAQSGLSFDEIEVEFKNNTLNNALIEYLSTNDIKTIKNYKIYSTNSGNDVLVVKLKYKGIYDYAKTIEIPISVKEYPISLVVNASDKDVYNIFDFYENSVKGEEFNVVVSKLGSYDRTFKIVIPEDQFNLVDIRYNNKLLDYETLTNLTFNSGSSIFIKAKEVLSVIDFDLMPKISFVSSSLFVDGNLPNDILTTEEGEKLSKTITLNLLPGVKTLEYDGVFLEEKDCYYLQSKNNQLVIDYVINKEFVPELSSVINIEFLQGENLIKSIENRIDNVNNKLQFVLTSGEDLGQVVFYLTSQNGLKTKQKKIQIYNYYDESLEQFSLKLESNNLKQSKIGEDTKYYLGLAEGKNFANIKVENPQNATIYDVVIESSNESAIKPTILNKENLTFNIFALNESVDPVKITIKILVYSANDVVNNTMLQSEIVLEFEVNTYYPITAVEVKQESVTVVDGMSLDIDSKNKKLNVLDVENLIDIQRNGDIYAGLKVEYIFPTNFIEFKNFIYNYNAIDNQSYALEEKEGSPFKKIIFFAGKSHKFVNNEYSFRLTIKIYDLEGGEGLAPITLNIVLKNQVQVDNIEILNDDGFVYLQDTDVYGQILTKVSSKTGEKVTNSSLTYEIVENNNSVNLDNEAGVLTIKAPGVTKVKISANSSKYNEDDEFAVYRYVYVIVADGSKNYPYILNADDVTITNGKYYTLKEDVVLNNQIDASINQGGIYGQFAYYEYSNKKANSTYNLIYKGLNSSIFASNETSFDFKNINIVIESSILNVNDDFGLISKVNKGIIEKVNLTISSLDISGNSSKLGLMFAENEGDIINSSVSGSVIINIPNVSFGGLVSENNGTIKGSYNFLNKTNNEYNANLTIVDKNNSNIVAGLVATNNGEVTNIKVNAVIKSNANVLAGLIGSIETTDKTYENLYFTGSLNNSLASSILGGIIGQVLYNNSFELLSVNFIENVNNSNYMISGSVVGGLVGEIKDSSIKFSYVTSFVNNQNLNGQVVGGLVGKSLGNLNLQAVYSNVSLTGEKLGALVGTSENIVISDAYSKSTGANSLVNETTNASVNETYSVSQQKVVENGTFTGSNNYTVSNYLETLNNSLFSDGNFFVISTDYNNGLPYLVYNKNGNYKKLLTIEALKLNANFVIGSGNFGNHSYGTDKNLIVIEENNNIYNKAVIFYQNNLEYNLDDFINITSEPSDANISDLVRILSSNENIIKIADGKVKIVGTGNVIITIQSKTNRDVKTEVYINVINKNTNFNLDYNNMIVDGDNYNFNISKSNTKLFGYNISNKTNNMGIYFGFSNNPVNSLLINNEKVVNNSAFITNDLVVYAGRDVFSSNVKVAPFYSLDFNGTKINLIENDLILNNLIINVLEGATSISVSNTSITVTEKEEAEFDVFVTPTSLLGDLEFEYTDDLGSILDTPSVTLISNDSGYLVYNVKVNAKAVNIVEEKIGQLKVWHNTNKDLYSYVNIIVRSSKLKSVELNHYGSKVTKYDDYNSIITKATTPNTEIVTGNTGVLNINLYPSYANITKVEIYSSVNNGNYILFNQLAYNNDDKLVVVDNRGNIKYGLSLDVAKSRLNAGKFSFDGNLYVSTLLSSNVIENTVFTVTVVCYTLSGETLTSSIELTAKPLTSVILTNANGSKDFYLAKGGELRLKVNKVNLTEDAISTISYEYDNRIISITPEDDELVVSAGILTPRNTQVTITPKFITYINGQRIEAKSNSITITIVDFVVNEIYVEDSEDGVLNNNLGNSTLLKAKINAEIADVTKLTSDQEKLEYSNILLKIATLEELISKDNLTWNLITQNNSGTLIYNNLKENGIYTNFKVGINEDGYYYVVGKVISNNNMALRANISYEKGLVTLKNSSNNEFVTGFALTIKTYSSLDNPLPITTKEEFLNMQEGQDYILLNDITLDAEFSGISVNVSSFDGNNKIINLQGFTILDASVQNLGLFNTVGEDSVIKNVTVNILPSVFYIGTDSKYGLRVNAQELTSLNFGLISGTNNGVITNCKVVNNNSRIVNKNNIYKNITIYVNTSESVDVKIGGVVGVNNGYITNSSFGSRNKNSITINSIAEIGGFVCINNKKIASSSVKNITIYNNAKSKLTGGFVCENNNGSSIITSFVEGYLEGSRDEVTEYIKDGGIFANGYVGGFATINSGNIKDSYSNIVISTNKRSAGFVYNNTNGYVETCYSASKSAKSTQSYRGFVGNNEENITLDNAGIKYCYFLGDRNENAGEDEYSEHANQIVDLVKAEYLEGFIYDNSTSTIWSFDGLSLPKLYDAEKQIICERKLLDDNKSSGNTELYEYIYINNNIGTINNPIMVSSTEELLSALTMEENLYLYYYNNKLQKTNINYNHIILVKDIDLSKLIDANNNVVNSDKEVQKLQDIVFAGNFNGNGMTIENITITAKNNTNYTSFGLFKQIGIENIYNTNGKLYNNKLDEDNCSVIKNLNLSIVNISATLTKSVGTLSGEVINSKLYNISVTGGTNVVVTGANMVGGIAGRISGNSYAKGISSSLSVKATYDNKTSNYDYNVNKTKNIYRNANSNIVLNDNDNNYRVNIAGGLFGVVDIYKTEVVSLVQSAGTYSYYINGKINRDNDENLTNANIQFARVTDEISISGDIVGGLFGYVESGSKIYDARLVLSANSNQNILASYIAGGIIGKNKGFVSYLTVEHELSVQRQLDALKQEEYKDGHLFSSIDNKAIYVGGLIGVIENGRIENSYSKANIIAKNSMYVGSIVGNFIDSKMNFVYAVSYLEAQDKEETTSGVITKNAGYAGLIGRISSFSGGSLGNISSVIRNTNTDSIKYNLAGLIGYNLQESVRFIDSEFVNNINGEENKTPAYYGKAISFTQDVNKEYNDFVVGTNTFRNYVNSDNWIINKAQGDVFYRLTYNKKGAVRAIKTEEDLKNLLASGGELQNDIYLTTPWNPISSFSGILTSAERPVEDRKKIGPDGEKLGQYYKIFNLNINEKSNNIASNIGLFATTQSANISNITIVVGSNYSHADEFGNIITYNNLGSDRYGIVINNKTLEPKDNINNLGTLSGYDKGSRFTNVTVNFVSHNISGENKIVNPIETNLTHVGGLVGTSSESTFENITIRNLKITKLDFNENAFVGGLAGLLTDIKEIRGLVIENIALGDENVGKIINNQKAGYNYIGGVAGRIINNYDLAIIGQNIDDSEEPSLIKLTKIKLESDGGEMVFAGMMSGEVAKANIKNVIIEDSSISATTTNKDLSLFSIGGLIGSSTNCEINNVNIKSNNKIEAETGDNTNFILNAGGLIGQSFSGEITNINISAQLNVSTKNTNVTSVGGLIGRNGTSGDLLEASDRTGSIVKNATVKTYIKVSGAIGSKDKNFVYIGGIIGYNYKTEIGNSIFLGYIKPLVSMSNYVGAIIGANIDNSGLINNASQFEDTVDNQIKVYAIEDLNSINKRNIDFGTFISYDNFIKDINKYLPIKVNNVDDILADEEIDSISGETIIYKQGSVYNPYILDNTSLIEDADTGLYVINNDDNYVHFVLNEDLSLDKTIKELNGIIIGNGYKLIEQSTLFGKINNNAMISSVSVVLENKEININNTDYTKNVTSIISNENNGLIYNLVTSGNIYYEYDNEITLLSDLASAVVTNNGFINLVTSSSQILINKNCDDDSSESNLVSGFVAKNTGAIFNSIAVGNIQNYQKVLNANKINTFLANLCGFTSNNESFIVNSISAVAIPDKGETRVENSNCAFGKPETSYVYNCYVDIYTNGDYNFDEIKANYIKMNEIENNIRNIKVEGEPEPTTNESSNIWVEGDVAVLFGYTYPRISIYEINDIKNILSTKDGEYYLINNFGVLQNTINKLQENEHITRVKIKQVASFRAKGYRFYKNDAGNYTYELSSKFEAISIIKPLDFNGNNQIISDLVVTSAVEIEEIDEKITGIYGLFYENTLLAKKPSINIENLAIVNLNILTTDKYDSIYAGLVAKTNGELTITNCYVSGTIDNETFVDAKTGEESKVKNGEVYVGGYAGYMNSSTLSKITNSVSEVNTALSYFKAKYTINKDGKTTEKTGYDGYVGGIVGFANNANINNNISLGNVSCSTVISLEMGGIVGAINKGEIFGNISLSKVAYKGAYFGYYNSVGSDLIYNVNAIVGFKGSATLSNNIYNSLTSLVGDKYINSEKELMSLVGLNFEIASNEFTTNNERKLIENLNFEVVTATNFVVESNKFYIVNLGENTEVTINYAEDKGNPIKNIKNTTIIFRKNCNVKVTENIFDKLENCTISNLTIKATDIVNTATLAKEIINSNLVNINIDNIYATRTSSENNGLLVDKAENSIISNVKVNYGRMEVVNNTSARVNSGAIVGYIKNSLISESENSATVTASFNCEADAGKTYYTAGIVGQMTSSYLFKCTNNGLVYAKNMAENSANMGTSGLTNSIGDSNYVSFCQNNSSVKGVNDSAKQENCSNAVTGITLNATTLYSINNGNIINVSKITDSRNNVATSISTGTIYYCYNNASVASSAKTYLLTQSTAYYSYSVGGGYATNGIDLTGNSNNFASYNLDGICKDIEDISEGKTYWYDKIINSSFDLIASSDDIANTKIILPIIRLIDGTKRNSPLKTNASGDTYQISTAYELWYWNRFVCGTEDDKNVELTCDIDMTGYSCKNTGLAFTKTFDGQYHTITSLTIKNQTDINHKDINGAEISYLSFIAINSGTIQNIYFEDPYVTNVDTTKGVTSNLYVGVVSGANAGTIQNILINAYSATSFIDLKYSKMKGEDEKNTRYVNIGVIAGVSDSGAIINCEVINLSSSNAIWYDFQLTGGTTDRPHNIKVYTGGIVGKNNRGSTIQNNIFMGCIKGHLVNSSIYFASLTGTLSGTSGLLGWLGSKLPDVVKTALFTALYSETSQYLGLIVGSNNGGTLGNNYGFNCDTKNKETLVENGMINFKTENPGKTISIGKEFSAMEVNVNRSMIVMGLSPLMGVATKKAITSIVGVFSKAAANSIGKGGPITTIVVMALTLVQEGAGMIRNNTALHPHRNLYGVCEYPTDMSSYLYNVNNSPYCSSLFSSDIINGTNYTFMTSKSTNTLNQKEIPILTDFLNISKKTENKILTPINGNYYVKTIEEFAKAITTLNGKNIILMDNIDMTKVVWDYANGSIKTNNITTNGFKVVYNLNTKFKDEYETKYGTCDYLIAKSDNANEYGKFNKFKISSSEASYNEFNERFRSAFKTDYEKEHGNTLGFEKAYNDYVDNGEYPIRCVEQLYIIGESLYSYMKDGRFHKGINFKGKKFVLVKNLNLDGALQDSITKKESGDYANYLLGKVTDYNTFAGIDNIYPKTIKTKNEEGEELIYVYNVETLEYYWQKIAEIDLDKEKIVYGDVSNPIVFTGKTQFDGEFDGKINDERNRQITTSNHLFTELGSSANLHNLTLNIKGNNIVTGMTSFGFIADDNYGTIKDVTLIVDTSGVSLTGKENLLEAIYYMTNYHKAYTYNGKSYENTIYSNISLQMGLVAGNNSGNIDTCDIKFTSNAFTFKYNAKYTRNAETKLDFVNGGEIEKISSEGFNYIVSVDINQGIVSGDNYGNINSINLSNVKLNMTTEMETKMKTDKEPGFTENDKIATNYNYGIISGSSTYGGEKQKQLTNIFIKDTILNINTKNDANGQINSGLICGYSSSSCEDIILINNLIQLTNIVKYSATGQLFGILSPMVKIDTSNPEFNDETGELINSQTIVKYYNDPEISKVLISSSSSERNNFVGKTHSISYEGQTHEGKTYYEIKRKTDKDERILGGVEKDPGFTTLGKSVDEINGLFIEEKFEINVNSVAKIGENIITGVSYSSGISGINGKIKLTLSNNRGNTIEFSKTNGSTIYYTSGTGSIYSRLGKSRIITITGMDIPYENELSYSGDNYYINVGNLKLFVNVTISANSITTGNEFTITKTCSVLSGEMKINANETWESLISRLPEDFSLDLAEDIDKTSEAESGDYTLVYNGIEIPIKLTK